jgi:hypothetical protein
MRGRLDDIYGLAANIGLVDRDRIMVGAKTYEVVEIAVNAAFNSFNTGWMAIELDLTDPNTVGP